nr:MAG TPA: hypothetical protein [Caudoviricetes sp.]
MLIPFVECILLVHGYIFSVWNFILLKIYFSVFFMSSSEI